MSGRECQPEVRIKESQGVLPRFRVQGPGFRVQGSGCLDKRSGRNKQACTRLCDLRFGAKGLGVDVQILGFSQLTTSSNLRSLNPTP